MDTQFDIEGAIKAGYTPAEINDYLGQQSGFDVAGARKAGYADDEILHHFTPRPEPPKDEGGFMASAKQAVGATIKGAGQAAADFIPGVGGDNALKQYGQEVIDANPTAVRGFGDIIESPWTATKEAVGNAAGSMGGMLGVRALGQGITAASPLAGPAAPVVAAIGQAVSWLGPAAIAALPSFGGIRDKQILDDPANEADAKSKAIAAMGAAAVGAIETAFGPQQWALAAMTKEGRAQTAKMFASTTLGKDIAKGVLKGGAIEGSEELAQNPIEQMASYSDPRTPENIKETLFGGAMGAIGGGVLGGAGGGLLHRKPALVEDVSVTPDPAILSANTADEAIAALGASVSSSLSATQSALDALKAQAGTMSAVPTGFGQQSELADLIAQEKADLELRRGTIAEQQGAMQALRQESELESTDARVEGARQEQSRQNRLQLLDAIYANPEERTPAMTFMSQLEAEFPNNPNPTPEEKQFMAQRESAYQAFKTEPVEPSLPNETDFGIKEAAPAEPAKPSVDRVRFAQRLLERPGNRLKGDVIRNKYGKVLLKLRPEEVSQVSPQSPVQTPIQSAVLPSAGAQPGQAAAAPIQPQGIQNEQAAQAIQSPAAVQDLPQAAPEAGALPDQLTPGSSAETESDGVAESAAPIVTQQSDNPPTITRIKGGKLAITGFTREDVSESLKTAKIAALVTAGADGKVLVSATDRAGNQVKLTIKQQNAIKKALTGAGTARAPKKRTMTGNLRNDINILAPGLYAEVARGGDGEGMDIDLSLVAERLRDEGFMLPTVETGKDSDAVIELIRQDLANGGGTLNERRATEAMEQDKAKKAREEALRPALELAGQSEAEIRDEEARIAEAKAAEEAEARKAEEQARREKAERDKADMQKRLENQPFEFGVGAKEAKKPQRDIFSAPSKQAVTTPPQGEASISRSRPKSTITFKRPIVGPSGAKVISYTWQWKPFDFIDARGEDRVGRMSDWDKAEENIETGRDVVHQFVIQDQFGDEKIVSLESAVGLLGFADGPGKARFKSVSSAAKTLARNQMQLAEAASAKEAFDRDLKEVEALPLPEVVRDESDPDKWYMGDTPIWQSQRLFPNGNSDSLLPERYLVLVDHWRDQRMFERGWKERRSPHPLNNRISDLTRRIAKAQARIDELVAQNSENQPASIESVTLYRGVKRGSNQSATVGDALFMSPDRGVAEMYAGKDGVVTERAYSFKNLLSAPNWAKAKEIVGLPQSASMADLVNAARSAGYDAVTFNTTNGKEYIVIGEQPAAPVAESLGAVYRDYDPATSEKQGYNEPAGPVAPIANESASSEAVSLSEVLKLAEGKTVSRQVVIAETGQTVTLNNQDAVATIKQINSDIQALEALRICIGG